LAWSLGYPHVSCDIKQLEFRSFIGVKYNATLSFPLRFINAAAQRCNDHVLRDPQTEIAAEALARTLGAAPVKAFLQRVLVLTKDQNWKPNADLKCCNDDDSRNTSSLLKQG